MEGIKVTDFLLLPSLFTLGIGIYKFRQLTPFFRLILLQVLLTITVEAIGLLIITLYHSKNNTEAYNFSLLIGGILLLRTVMCWLTTDTEKMLLILSIGLHCSIGLVCTLHDSHQYAANAFITDSILLLGWFLCVLYKSAFKASLSFKNPVLWYCFGIVISSGTSIPYYSLMNFLNTHYPALSFDLFKISLALAFINDCCTLIAFSFYKNARVYDYRTRDIV